MSSDHDAGVVGFDVPTIERWLATVTTVRSPIVWQRLPGGHSNLTFLLVDDGGRNISGQAIPVDGDATSLG